jgi:hypothetical protein
MLIIVELLTGGNISLLRLSLLWLFGEKNDLIISLNKKIYNLIENYSPD